MSGFWVPDPKNPLVRPPTTASDHVCVGWGHPLPVFFSQARQFSHETFFSEISARIFRGELLMVGWSPTTALAIGPHSFWWVVPSTTPSVFLLPGQRSDSSAIFGESGYLWVEN